MKKWGWGDPPSCFCLIQEKTDILEWKGFTDVWWWHSPVFFLTENRPIPGSAVFNRRGGFAPFMVTIKKHFPQSVIEKGQEN